MTFLEQVNQQQREAIKTIEGPVMVVAGPGSGKTRVLTYRIANLLSIGVPAYQILALTFTNKAANEMKERIVKLVGTKSQQLWMGTFHSIFARLLRMECERLGFEKNFSIYDSDDSMKLIKSIMADLHIPAQQYQPTSIRYRISKAKNHVISPEAYADQALDLIDEKTVKVYGEYVKRLKRNNAMDFDDLLLKPIELFSHHKTILEKYQDRFRFILIDEYQDTNRAQYLLVKLLADKFKNICVVGDDAQSIYAFRGADIRNILDFNRDYPEARVVRLEQNYRSTKVILSAADQVIRRNTEQITKKLWTENTTGDPIDVLECADDRSEGESIVKLIFRSIGEMQLNFRDVAIMYRTNAQSRSIEDALRKNSIPYTIIGGVEFYQRKEIKDVLGYLRLLVNPADDESYLRVINYPNRGLGEVAVRHLRTFASDQSISLLNASARAENIAGLTKKAKANLTRFAAVIGKYRKLKEELSSSELSRILVDELGILRLYKDEGTPEALVRWENVQELLSAISEFTGTREDGTLENFLQEVSLVSDIDKWDESMNAVTLMTLHSAKGLEFPIVFITGLEEGLLPYFNSSMEATELEEERRLFYVGITRAMKKLVFTLTKMRFRFADISYQSPSRFLDEIDPDLLNKFQVNAATSPRRYDRSPSNKFVTEKKKRKKTESDGTYYTDEMPDYERHDHELSELRIGSVVEHETFGRGKVAHMAGSGDESKLVVAFDSVGRKNLLLKYARLKIV